MTSLFNVSDCPCGHCQRISCKDQGDIAIFSIRLSLWTLSSLNYKDQGDIDIFSIRLSLWTLSTYHKLQGSGWHRYLRYQNVLWTLSSISYKGDIVIFSIKLSMWTLSKYQLIIQGSGWHWYLQYQIVLVDIVNVSVTRIRVKSISSVSDCPCGHVNVSVTRIRVTSLYSVSDCSCVDLVKYQLQGSKWHRYHQYQIVLVDLVKVSVTRIRVTSLLNVSDGPCGPCQSVSYKDQL